MLLLEPFPLPEKELERLWVRTGGMAVMRDLPGGGVKVAGV